MLRKKLFNGLNLTVVSFAITFGFVARPVVAQIEAASKITGVTTTIVRSGSRITVSGISLENVEGGYFGQGTPGSVQNPLSLPALREFRCPTGI